MGGLPGETRKKGLEKHCLGCGGREKHSPNRKKEKNKEEKKYTKDTMEPSNHSCEKKSPVNGRGCTRQKVDRTREKTEKEL